MGFKAQNQKQTELFRSDQFCLVRSVLFSYFSFNRTLLTPNIMFIVSFNWKTNYGILIF